LDIQHLVTANSSFSVRLLSSRCDGQKSPSLRLARDRSGSLPRRVVLSGRASGDRLLPLQPLPVVYIFLMPGNVSLRNQTGNQVIVPELLCQQNQIINGFLRKMWFGVIENLDKMVKTPGDTFD
jgi:hypothetical protein